MFTKHIILASQSPRRRELLRDFGFDFEAVSSGADESGTEGMSPADAVCTLALRKAKWVKENRDTGDSVVLAADT